MSFPVPEPGLVISYGYLWRHEREAGKEEGRKDRPCVIVLAVETQDDTTLVTVAPMTHRAPPDHTVSLEIPPRVKQHLGLDRDTSWVVVSEVNQFTWPGYDLRPVPGSKNRFDYGFLPPALFARIKAAMLDQLAKRRAGITSRD